MNMEMMEPGDGRGKHEKENVDSQRCGWWRRRRAQGGLSGSSTSSSCPGTQMPASPPHNLTHQMMMSVAISCDQHCQFSSHCPIIVAVFSTLPLPWLELPEGWDGQGPLPMAIMATEDGHRRPSPSSMAASRWNPLNSWEGQLSYSCSSVLVLSMTLINSLKRPRPLAVQVLMTI